jgi:hypothetical protein
MLEKFSDLNVDFSSSGSEYVVHVGLAWTNNVLI